MCLETAIKFGLIEKNSKEVLNIIIGSSSLIDAYAGLLGMSTIYKSQIINKFSFQEIPIDSILFTSAGTSSCYLTFSKDKYFHKGIWGPYYNSLFDGYFVHEAGQSSTGSLIEHIVKTHPDYYKHYASFKVENLIDLLTQELISRKSYKLLKTLHISTFFHGNRSPLADANLKGKIFIFCFLKLI